ncbi:DUF5710 domain-containing protein [Zoogloea sp.]|uniref:DUF5710 domain-containing protein n=1 Tax=Zoogloea sp. TaxID=49181 RepID=UPI0026141A28|nr:DUF5710 domain-containing protein [Zoogloea sp.]
MRVNLKVPFAEKDEAKKLGARWDAARKIWYVENKPDMAPFARWAPSPHESSAGTEPVHKSAAPVKKQQAASMVIVGSAYVEQARVCDCLPWEVCERCEPTALSR